MAEAEGKPVILLVEDNLVNQKVAMLHLNKLGYSNVDIADDGQQALEAWQNAQGDDYALVLMDCQMPVMDGFEATRSIRSREQHNKHTVIIAMTANALAEDRVQCLQAGMDDYLAKPVDASMLQAMLDKWLHQKHTLDHVGEKRNMEIAANTAPVVDFERLKNMFGDDDATINDLLNIFVTTTEPLFPKIKTTIDAADFAGVKALGHQVAGSAANLGIQQMHVLARELEAAAAANDGGQCQAVLERIMAAFTDVSNVVKQAA